MKEISARQVEHTKENMLDPRTWAKYTETTFFLTSQWWKLGDNEGDALCGVGPGGVGHAVARIGDKIAEVRSTPSASLEESASLVNVLAKLGYKPITEK